ncbi:MAG: ABC transporter substrate-binding protein, partial [Phycisphaerae bacterium]|nr:ABC transporter substrate-binding protein [Phycisphaerae bacterium]
MKSKMLLFSFIVIAVLGCNKSSQPQDPSDSAPVMLTVGHVGHDHQLALFVAALEGERFKKASLPYLKEVKPREVYELIENGKKLALLRFVKVGGGSRMPAAMTRGELDIGLGGVAAVAKFADKGQPFKIICPLQTDGDMLVMRTGSEINDWDSFVAAAKNGKRPLKIGYKAPTAVAKLVFVGALKSAGIPFSQNPADKNARVVLINMMSEKSPLPLLESQ